MKELLNILKMTDGELGGYLKCTLKKHYKKVLTDGDNYIYAKGTSPLCLVAHIDTVRGKNDLPVNLVVSRNVIRNASGVLGADDRAGVYGILEVMRGCIENNFPMPHIIFTNYEESGGRGVKAFIRDKKFDPRGIDLLVELDRKGCNEYVFYSTTLPQPVKDYVKSFGFREERGSYSDISDLTDEYQIPSVNLSIGYYSQHCNAEYLHYDECLLTIDRVLDMCEEPIGKLHKVVKPYYPAYNSKYNKRDNYGEDWEGFYTGGTNYSKHSTYLPKGITDKAVVKIGDVHKDVTTADSQLDLKFADDVALQVLLAIRGEKELLKSDLMQIYNIDNVADTFLMHENALPILEKLSELLEIYVDLHNSDIVGIRAFHVAWDKVIDSEIIKRQKALAIA